MRDAPKRGSTRPWSEAPPSDLARRAKARAGAIMLARLAALAALLAAACPERDRPAAPPPVTRAMVDAAPPAPDAAAPATQPSISAGERASAEDCAAMFLNIMLVGYRERNDGRDPPPDIRAIYAKTVESETQAIDNCVKQTRSTDARCMAKARRNADLARCAEK